MLITFSCPRCKRSMSLAGNLAGRYATCPHCNGRFWIPKDLPDKAKTAQPAAQSTDDPVKQTDSSRPGRPQPSGPQQPSRCRKSSSRPQAGGPSPSSASRQQSAPDGNVARFITAEAAQSTLNLAEDGQLPELRLEESRAVKAQQESGTTVHPLVLVVVLCLSVVAAAVLVLIPVESESSSGPRKKQRARLSIESDYVANLDAQGPQEPYQVYLREAQRAHSRGDRKAETRLYREVLDMLRAERSEFEGVTGSPDRDRELEKRITILLSDD